MTATSAAAPERPVVQLTQGRARGVWSDAEAGLALFAGLPGEDRELLQEQEVAMATYLSILNRRIHRFFQS